ncbi:hypothetical protein HYU19_00355 [Candidatus Woesearchaeota archaeon]|nr:hypothetical protein [Candidatus Woesearchaeota archaeon]
MAELGELTRRDFVRLSGLTGLCFLAGLNTESEAADGKLEILDQYSFAERVRDNKRPTIAYFGIEEEDLDERVTIRPVCQRMKKVVEALAAKYPQIDFFYVPVDVIWRRGNMTRQQFKEAFNIEDVFPQTVMYARHDVLTGKTYDKNVKIDVSIGGPMDDRFIPSWIKQYAGWIDFNITNKYDDKPYTARWNGDTLVQVQKVSQ